MVTGAALGKAAAPAMEQTKVAQGVADKDSDALRGAVADTQPNAAAAGAPRDPAPAGAAPSAPPAGGGGGGGGTAAATGLAAMSPEIPRSGS